MNKGKVMESQGLPPIGGKNPEVLILGTFPGKESLRQGKYYANARNLFWDIMECICGAGRDKDYETRVAILKNTGICLWDVLESCERNGSSDKRIRNGQVNDLSAFLSRYPMKAIFFNGKKAEKLFCRRVVTELRTLPPMYLLPSTSPANTSKTRDQKFRQWCIIKQYLK
jgi:TDG/mug DNA glycosylase family protein